MLLIVLATDVNWKIDDRFLRKGGQFLNMVVSVLSPKTAFSYRWLLKESFLSLPLDKLHVSST